MNLDVFELVEDNNDLVVVKNLAKDNLLIAKHPYLSKEYDYFTITKGINHVFTIIKEDGKTTSFDWGENGYTLISRNLELLKEKVVDFIEQENHIMLEYTNETIKERVVYCNSNFNKWQLTLKTPKGSRRFWSKTATNLQDFLKEIENIKQVGKRNWKKSVAPTGITIWVA